MVLLDDLRFAAVCVLTDIASDIVLEAAFAWLCKRRQNYPDHADVWSFRRGWPEQKARLLVDPLSGGFRFGLLQRITDRDGKEIDLWAPRDALVLKALAMVLPEYLPVSSRCTHWASMQSAGAAKDKRRHRNPKI